MVCPRCQRECEVESAVCAHCGAPFLLGDDPPPPALDRPVVLDRRGRGRQGTPAATPLAHGSVAGPVVEPAVGPGVEPAIDTVVEPAVDLGLVGAEPPEGIAGTVDVSTEAPPARPAPGSDLDRALRWRRAAARGVDLGVVLLFAAIPLAIAGGLDAAPAADGVLVPHAAMFAAILAFVYETLAHCLAGATAGKHLLRLQVVSPDGGSPGLARSAARAAVSVVGAAALGLPALAALFTRRCRTLHDVVAGTSVVRAP